MLTREQVEKIKAVSGESFLGPLRLEFDIDTLEPVVVNAKGRRIVFSDNGRLLRGFVDLQNSIDDILETLVASLKVVEAARECARTIAWTMEDPTNRACGMGCDMHDTEGGKPGHDGACPIKEIADALKPFAGQERGEAKE